MLKKKYQGRDKYELTSEECERLFKSDYEVLKNAYPDPSKGFARSVMTKSGNIYSGISYGSDTATLTMHSEATAFAHAAIHGEPGVIAITGSNCHICKQLIWENSLKSGIEIVVVLKEDGKVKQIPITEMMPYPWPEREHDK